MAEAVSIRQLEERLITGQMILQCIRISVMMQMVIIIILI
jgi:hypothetical protein